MFFIIFLIVAVVAFFSWQTMRVNPNTKGTANISLLVGVGAVLVALSNCFTVIPAGNIGVVDFFGQLSVYGNEASWYTGTTQAFACAAATRMRVRANRSESRGGVVQQFRVLIS